MREISMERRWWVLIIAMLLIPSLTSVNTAGTDLGDSSGSEPTIEGEGRGKVDWTGVVNDSYSFSINSSTDMRITYDHRDVRLNTSEPMDPYLALNTTLRRAVDRVPMWLNRSMCWRLTEVNDYYIMRYVELLMNESINPRYLDELSFIIVNLPIEKLNSYWTITGCSMKTWIRCTGSLPK